MIKKQNESRQGRKKMRHHLKRTRVLESRRRPRGLLPPLRGFRLFHTLLPTVETVGYFRVSLRD